VGQRAARQRDGGSPGVLSPVRALPRAERAQRHDVRLRGARHRRHGEGLDRAGSRRDARRGAQAGARAAAPFRRPQPRRPADRRDTRQRIGVRIPARHRGLRLLQVQRPHAAAGARAVVRLHAGLHAALRVLPGQDAARGGRSPARRHVGMAPLVPASGLPFVRAGLARALCALHRAHPLDLVRGRRHQHEERHRFPAFVVSERHAPPLRAARRRPIPHRPFRLFQRALPRSAVARNARMVEGKSA